MVWGLERKKRGKGRKQAECEHFPSLLPDPQKCHLCQLLAAQTKKVLAATLGLYPLKPGVKNQSSFPKLHLLGIYFVIERRKH